MRKILDSTIAWADVSERPDDEVYRLFYPDKRTAARERDASWLTPIAASHR